MGVGVCTCASSLCYSVVQSKSEVAAKLAQLSKAEESKLEAILRRLCKADRKGNYQVPEQVHKMWKRGGSHRRELRKVLLQCNGQKDPHPI